MDIETVKPEEIEKKSFETITTELQGINVVINKSTPVNDGAPELDVIKRCIHTTADFEYAHSMIFSDGAYETFAKLVRGGATIVTDTNMALAGISKRELARYGCDAVCFMADEDVALEAKKRQLTRAHVSMERAMSIKGPVIFVIGNAPTALITLCENHTGGVYSPAFVVGVPVGFVNVEAAKEMLAQSSIGHITNIGRKGGSNVAAAIVNAMLYRMRQ